MKQLLPIPIIIVCMLMYFQWSYIQDLENNRKHLLDKISELLIEIDSLENLEEYYVIGTKYNAVPEQCDSTPLITADNTKINIKKLNNHELRYVALSQDLFKYFKLGDTIEVSCNNRALNGTWVIRDKMNSRWINKIDFLVPIKDTFNFTEPIPLKIKKL